MLQIDQLGSLTANKLIIQAQNMFVYGHIQAANALTLADPNLALNCTGYELEPSASDYSLTILATVLRVEVGGLLASGAVGICSANASIEGYITASGLGHLKGLGDSAGCAASVSVPSSPANPLGLFQLGAGSGAGHGGAGGNSGAWGNKTGCVGGGLYDATALPAMQGSGGGGLKGGAGGGVVHLQAVEELVLLNSGELRADGEKAELWRPHDFYEAPDGSLVRCAT
eukprot:1059755-Prymnesium_polylepis.1